MKTLKPIQLLFIFKLTSMTFFVADSGYIYLVPRVSKELVDANLTMNFYIGCHSVPCLIDARLGSSNLSYGEMNAFQTREFDVPVLVYNATDMTAGEPLYVNLSLSQTATVIVGHSGSNEQAFFNTFAPCSIIPCCGKYFIITFASNGRHYTTATPFVLIVASADTLIQVASSSPESQNKSVVFKAKRGQVLLLEDGDDDLYLQGAVLFAVEPLSVYVGGRLIQACLRTREDWGQTFVFISPPSRMVSTISIFVDSDTVLEKETYENQAGVRVYNKLYVSAGEFYFKASKPICIVYSIGSTEFKKPIRVLFATMPAIHVWSQEVSLRVPYRDVDTQRSIVVLALTEDFIKILVNHEPISKRIVQPLNRLLTNRNFSWARIDHKETLFFSLASPKDYNNTQFSVSLYSLNLTKGFYYGKTRSCPYTAFHKTIVPTFEMVASSHSLVQSKGSIDAKFKDTFEALTASDDQPENKLNYVKMITVSILAVVVVALCVICLLVTLAWRGRD